MTIRNPNNPYAGMWFIRRKSDRTYLTWDGWGRHYWTPIPPGGYVGYSRAEAVAIAKQYGEEEDFEYLEVPGAMTIEEATNFASLLEIQ